MVVSVGGVRLCGVSALVVTKCAARVQQRRARDDDTRVRHQRQGGGQVVGPSPARLEPDQPASTSQPASQATVVRRCDVVRGTSQGRMVRVVRLGQVGRHWMHWISGQATARVIGRRNRCVKYTARLTQQQTSLGTHPFPPSSHSRTRGTRAARRVTRLWLDWRWLGGHPRFLGC